MYPSTLIQALINKARLIPAQILLNHQQRIYKYRLLSLSNDHVTKQILYKSFESGDMGNVQVDEKLKESI